MRMERRRSLLRFLLAISVVAVWGFTAWFDIDHQPALSAHAAVAAVNGGDAQLKSLQIIEAKKNFVALASGLWSALALAIFALSYYPPKWMIRIPPRAIPMAAILTLPLFTGGCYKPYDTPQYVSVNTSETAFVVPLEGQTSDQSQFQSEQFLAAHEVAIKRIQVTHRWNPEGYAWWTGEWIPNVQVIKVDRTPVTRLWTAENASGTSPDNQAIWVESGDSVGFSMGFMLTAYIDLNDAAKFLYNYPAGSLDRVMDGEVRARVQSDAADFAAKYPLDELRDKKSDMMTAIRADVLPYFKSRGITISAIGMYGGMTYENPDIQKAIDNVFIAQQLKNVAQANFDAQSKTNETLDLAASGLAKKTITEAQAEAQAREIAAEADAEAIETVNAALAKGNASQVLAFRQLDLEKARIEKWDGAYPTFFMGQSGGNSPSLMIQMPAGEQHR